MNYVVTISYQNARSFNYYFDGKKPATEVYELITSDIGKDTITSFDHHYGNATIRLEDIQTVEVFPQAAIFEQHKEQLHIQHQAELEVAKEMRQSQLASAGTIQPT